MARLPHENAPGIPLTGIGKEERRATDAALLRQSEKRFTQLEESRDSLARAQRTLALTRDYRRNTRSIQDTDTLTLRTLTASDLIISLEGAGGTLVLHSAANFARTDFVLVRNNASADWNLDVSDPGTEEVYLGSAGATSAIISPGQQFMLWNRTSTRFEAY